MNSNWKMVTFGEILKPSQNIETPYPTQKYRQIGVKWWGEGVYERETIWGSETSYQSFTRLEAGDLIYNKIWARHGSVSVVQNDLAGCHASTEFPVYKIDSSQALPTWILWLTKQKSFWEKCAEKAFGTSGKNRIKPSEFLSLEIPLPSLTEQQRIAGRLAALKGKIDAVRALRGEQVREVSRLTFDVLDQFFVKGEEKSIGQICEKPQYGYTASADFQNIGVRFVRITDIQNGQVQWGSVPYCQCEKPDNYLLKENDILFARTGGTIGKSFLVKTVPEDAVFASYLIRLRVKEGVLPEFLYLFFQSKSYWQQITDSKTGTGQPNLNGSKLSEIVLKVPDLTEQRRIVSEIQAFQTKMEQLKAAQAGQLAGLEGLFPAVLERAFRGEW